MFLTSDNNLKWAKLGWAAIITGLVVLVGIVWFDKPLFLFMRNLDCGLWRVMGDVFDDKVWFFAALITLIVFYMKKSVQAKIKFRNDKNKFSLRVLLGDFYVKIKDSYAFLIFCSIVSAGALASVLKVLIGRARPVLFEGVGVSGFFPPSFDWVFHSMPSGHTTVSFAGLVMIGLLAPRYKVITWTLATLVAVSRVAVGAHWPTDVVLGAFIGMALADIVKWALGRK